MLDAPVLLSPRTMLIASMLDGVNETVDIPAACARRTGGDLLFSWDIQQVIDEFDRLGLLLTDLILGVAHKGPDAPYTLTAKPFQIPLGVAAVNHDVVDFLKGRVDGMMAHELAHRHEHSIEFQVVFLQHLLRDRRGHRWATAR